MRLPAATLLEHMYTSDDCRTDNKPSGPKAADKLGISLRTVYRWQSRPDYMIGFYDADTYCTRLGISISDVWGPAIYREAIGV